MDEARQTQNNGKGYFALLVNEYSYKFWAVTSVIAMMILAYGVVAALYLSKVNFSPKPDYEYDYFAKRSAPDPPTLFGLPKLSPETIQRILRALEFPPDSF